MIRKKAILIFALIIAVLFLNSFGVSVVYASHASNLQHDPALLESTIRYGIDVSEWQGDIDWASVANSDMEFAFIRIAYRGYGAGIIYEDSKAYQNIRGALDAGLNVGVYIYSQAINAEEAIAEADKALDILKKAGVGPESLALPVIIDVEFADDGSEYCGRLYEAYLKGEMSRATRTDVTLAFLNRIKSAGYDAGIYAGSWVLSTWHDMSRIENKYKVWIAAWLDECPYEGRYDFWQYSASGSVPGIIGTADLDVWYDSPGIHGEIDGSWRYQDGKWYYYTATGELKKWWLLKGGEWYYLGADGAMKHGWHKVDNTWYYFGSPGDSNTGAMAIGWRNISGRWYYFGFDGPMKRGWQKVDDEWYYLGSGDNTDTGAMATGWNQIDGKWYYFGSNGVMKRGWHKVDGKWYYMHSYGVMASNEYVDGYWFNRNGSWTYPHRATWRGGEGRWWYGDDSGWYAKNATYKINGVDYIFDASGYLK